MTRTALASGMLALMVLSAHADPDNVASVRRSEESVLQRVRQIRESDTDAWRRIPWSPSLIVAAEAARKEDRPIFVFSHEGNIDTGRC